MVCPYCGQQTMVINSRHQKRNNQVWRRRRCVDCLTVFTSLETYDLSGNLKVEKNGDLRPFISDYLFMDILTALKDRNNPYIEARELTNTVIQKVLTHSTLPVIKSEAISKITADVLRRFDRQAWHRYTAEHSSLIS